MIWKVNLTIITNKIKCISKSYQKNIKKDIEMISFLCYTEYSKGGKMEGIYIRLIPKLKEQLKEEAKEKGMTLTNYIRMILMSRKR